MNNEQMEMMYVEVKDKNYTINNMSSLSACIRNGPSEGESS